MRIFLLLLSFPFFFTSCSKDSGDETSRIEVPVLTTTPITALANTNAMSGGNISSQGGAPVTQRGVCWSTSPAPTISDAHTTDGSGTGIFTSNIYDLNAGSTYYVRAYATNTGGTGYGNEVTLTTAPIDVYAAGYFDGKAVWWKNGVMTSLSSNSAEYSIAHSIFVNGNDVYIAGTETPQFGNEIATVWKNGVPTYLSAPNHLGYAKAVFVSGNDVYVAGVVNDGTAGPGGVTAVLWKNNVPIILTSSTTNAIPQVNSIYVNGNDVYVAGSVKSNFVNTPAVWKNGVLNTYSTGTPPTSGTILSITGDGNNIYASGVEAIGSFNHARLWKNGIVTDLGTGQANSVITHNNNVYVAGIQSSPSASYSAMIWKNSSGTPLLTTSSMSEALDVAVHGTTVYVTGSEVVNSISIAKLWKNNTSVSLTNGTKNGGALSVFLKQ